MPSCVVEPRVTRTLSVVPEPTLGADLEEKKPLDDFKVLQQVNYHSHWKGNHGAVFCKIYLSTKSRIAILANVVTCDYLERSSARVHLQSNLPERTSNTVERHLTPRLARKVTLKSNRQYQQQQSKSICDHVSTGTRKFVYDRTGTRDVRGNSKDDKTCTRQLMRNSVSHAD